MIPLTKQIFSIYKIVLINQKELIKYYPYKYAHYFGEEVEVQPFTFMMLSKEIDEFELSRLQYLNSYLISKLGRKGLQGRTKDQRTNNILNTIKESL